MNIKFTEFITIKVPPEEIEKLVRGALDIAGYDIIEIKFNTIKYAEDEEKTFEGVTAECKRKTQL